MNRRHYRLEVEQLEDRLAPATVTWDGGGDGTSWGDGVNWDGDTLPTSVDDTVIGFSAAVSISAGSVIVNSVDCDGTLSLAATASLTLAAASQISTYFDCAGALTLQAGATLDLYGMYGVGEISGPVSLAAGSVVNLASGQLELDNATITGAGRLVMNPYTYVGITGICPWITLT